jgi:hypothetical protein
VQRAATDSLGHRGEAVVSRLVILEDANNGHRVVVVDHMVEVKNLSGKYNKAAYSINKK